MLTKPTTGMMLSFLLSLTLAPAVASAACAGGGESRKVTTLWASADQSQKGYGSNTKLENIPVQVTGCQNELLQIAFGVSIPSSLSYAGLTYFSKDLPHAEKCEVDVQDQHIKINHVDILKPMLSKALNCLALEIIGSNSEPIEVLNKQSCKILENQGPRVLVQGETCTIKANGNYKIEVKTLNCDMNSDRRALDVDLKMSLQTADATTHQNADSIFAKNYRLSVSEVQSEDTRKVKNDAPENFSVYRKPLYQLDFDLYRLRLDGSKDTGLTATARYYIDHQNLQSQTSANNARIPFVVKNDLYLVKGKNDPILLGQWYNASIVSAQWQGVDGNPTFNSVGQGDVTGTLNESTKQIVKGDLLVLKSQLEDPNVGTIKYFKYLKSQLEQYIKAGNLKKAAASRAKIGELLEALPLLETFNNGQGLEPLTELSTDPTALMAKRKNVNGAWGYRFDQFCDQKNNCLDLASALNTKTIETVFQVIDDAFSIQLAPVKNFTKWGDEKGSIKNQTKVNNIQCL